jgi:hypothetical protein
MPAKQGNAKDAAVPYQRAAVSGHRDYAPKTAAYLGGLLATQQDVDGRRRHTTEPLTPVMARAGQLPAQLS